MAATTLKLTSGPVLTAPRGAGWAASAFATVLLSTSSLLARAAEQRRISAELRAMQEMLRLANSYNDTQPGFAADLRAAAMRANAD